MFETIHAAGHCVKAYRRMRKVQKCCEKLDKQEARATIQRYMRFECDGILKTIPVRVIFHGLEKIPEESGILFAGNHQSYFDIPIMLSAMDTPTTFVAKQQLMTAPIIGHFLTLMECVPMDRSDIRASVQAIKDANQLMRDGLNLFIFPEGTRSRSDEVGRFKPGSLKCAFLSNAPIVPFFIDGAHHIFESNKPMRCKPCEVHVYFGDPISTEGLSRQEQKELCDRLREICIALKEA